MWASGPSVLVVLLAGIVWVLSRSTYAWIPERKPLVLGFAAATATLLGVTFFVEALLHRGEISWTVITLLPLLMAVLGALITIAVLQIHLFLLDGPTAGFHRRLASVGTSKISSRPLLFGALFTPVSELRARRR